MFSELKRSLFAYLPPSWRHPLVEVKNALWGGWKHETYAHFGEDAFVNAFFRNKKKGFYVDIGAHHPKRYSNTALLYQRGWWGINVDPDSHLIKSFYRDRKDDINLNIGVALHEDTLVLHRFSDPAVNTFSQENADRLKQKKWLKEISPQHILVKPLSSVLDEHVGSKCSIDFLNIDVEDLDLEVLQSNNWNAYRPILIAVEDRFFDPREFNKSEIYNFLVERDYIFMAYMGLTLIMVDRAHVDAWLEKRGV